MVHKKSNLYEISVFGYEKLKWYSINVKRWKRTFTFEVNESSGAISIFYIDELGRKRAIVSMDELEMLLVMKGEIKKSFVAL